MTLTRERYLDPKKKCKSHNENVTKSTPGAGRPPNSNRPKPKGDWAMTKPQVHASLNPTKEKGEEKRRGRGRPPRGTQGGPKGDPRGTQGDPRGTQGGTKGGPPATGRGQRTSISDGAACNKQKKLQHATNKKLHLDWMPSSLRNSHVLRHRVTQGRHGGGLRKNCGCHLHGGCQACCTGHC